MELAWKVDPGTRVNLNNYDPNYTGKHTNREEAEEELLNLSNELSDLQEWMASAQQHSLLMVLQGMDTSGKDGTIRHVLAHVNPQGCQVHAFKVPTPEELAHDYLWRVHKVTPAKGMMDIFNRSHYEDVLVVRVHNLVPESEWKQRYEEINQFEHLLARNNTIILKFFLYISYDEQTKRLEEREKDIYKAWKLSPADWAERKYWNSYQAAYEDALSKCSTGYAPWYIVPANHKWFRNLAIAHTLVHTMKQHEDEWKTQLAARGRQVLEELKKMKENQEPSPNV